MQIKIFEFNPVSENTYILFDNTRECVIIDAGCLFPTEEQALLSFIKNEDLNVKYLLNTHLHFDHVFGNSFIYDQFGLRTKAHRADEFLLETMSDQLRMFNLPQQKHIPVIGEYIEEGNFICFGNQTLDILEVPGHSPGSIAFYNKTEHLIIAGDALFKGSIGRTDLPRADHAQLLNSIRTKLFTLPDNTIVLPGHGEQTTIGWEKNTNPFFS